ncbi:MAG: hypothetical protein LBE11_03140 [Prevotellaceae bacterium]|jgi:hypothetical protein|nr:hypothetical protein [Prevotellaceae bacterium]
MLILKCYILIEGKDNKIITFDYVSSVEITTSVKDFTDTAKITVPRKMQWRGKPLTDFINRGNEITVQLGYEGHKIETVFKGYIKAFTHAAPIVIDCENEMYALKQIKVKAKKYDKFDFKQFMQEYAPKITFKLPDEKALNFGEVIIKDEMSVASVYLSLFDIYKLSFTTATFNQTEWTHFNIMPFSLTFDSDSDYDFLVKGD